MKLLVFLPLMALMVGCASALEKKNAAGEVETKMEKSASIGGDERVGVKDGSFKVQKKVMLAEELRHIENSTYAIEYEVYGNRDYGTKGLYGAYKECKAKANSVEFGGSGKMIPIEPPAPVINEDTELKFGEDEKGSLVGVSEEFLSERIDRFKKYKKILEKRRTEYETKLEICQNEVAEAEKKVAKENI